MQVVSVLRKWFHVLRDPYGFFNEVNQKETGQRKALFFFVFVAVLAKTPEYILEGIDPYRFVVFGALILLLSPVFLHILTGLQYLMLWVFTPKDKGVDRALRAVAYGAAPAVFSWIPILGIIAVYGVYLQYVGIRVGHSMGRARAVTAVLLPATALYGWGFRGFYFVRQLLDFLEPITTPFLARLFTYS